MDNKYKIDDLVKVNGFYGMFKVLNYEYDTFLGIAKMLFYVLESLDNGHIITTYEHNILEIKNN